MVVCRCLLVALGFSVILRLECFGFSVLIICCTGLFCIDYICALFTFEFESGGLVGVNCWCLFD